MGALGADAFEGEQKFPVAGQLAVVFVYQLLGDGFDLRTFVTSKTCTFDEIGDFSRRQTAHFGGRSGFTEKPPGDGQRYFVVGADGDDTGD